MKKALVILACLLSVFVFIIVLNPPEIIIEDNIMSHQRPELVPPSALWAGGVDGGNFIYVKEFKKEDSLFFAQIYNDFTGELEFEGVMKYIGTRDISNSLNIKSFYSGWDGENLHLSNGDTMTIYDNKNLTSH